MKINAQLPTELLKPYIKAYIFIESPGELVNRVLPDTSLVMAFRYKGRVSYVANDAKDNFPSSTLSGLRKSLRLFKYSPDTGNILVIFKEASVTAFFKEPIHELFDETVALDNFISHQRLSDIEEQLAEAKNNKERIAVIELFLVSKLFGHKPDNLILGALQRIRAAKGIIKIKDLCGSLYISQDAFEKRFRRVVGTSPKHFSSTVRMESIIAGGRQTQTLTKIAFGAGYFDQAHFNKDFKLFTGQTPTDFFKSPSFLQVNDFLL